MNFTPGPWELELHDYGDEIWLGGRDEGMATIKDPNDKYNAIAYLGLYRVDEPERTDERVANAKLIAAAPLLLEACKEAANFLIDEYPSAKPIRGLLLAVDKATQ